MQEAYLRRQSADDVENERAWLTTVTTRLAIDVLRSARVRREAYEGSWLPEPLVEAEAPGAVESEESVSLAMLVLLERLSPVERAVFVLRESFDVDFDEIAAIVDKSEANCRQILARARRRIDDERPRFDADPRERRALAARFLAAAREGDLEGLRRRARTRRRPDRRRRRHRPLDPAPDGRRRGRGPRDRRRSTARSTSGASPSSRPGSTASRASERSPRTASSSTWSASTSWTATWWRSARCSTRTSSRTSARSRIWVCALQRAVKSQICNVACRSVCRDGSIIRGVGNETPAYDSLRSPPPSADELIARLGGAPARAGDVWRSCLRRGSIASRSRGAWRRGGCIAWHGACMRSGMWRSLGRARFSRPCWRPVRGRRWAIWPLRSTGRCVSTGPPLLMSLSRAGAA